MSDTITITLAGTSYAVRKFTLRQFRALGDTLSKELPTDEGAKYLATLDRAISVITIALSRDHPGATLDSLLDMESDPTEVITASSAVLTFSGCIPRTESAPGEADPGASTGAS